MVEKDDEIGHQLTMALLMRGPRGKPKKNFPRRPYMNVFLVMEPGSILTLVCVSPIFRLVNEISTDARLTPGTISTFF